MSVMDTGMQKFKASWLDSLVVVGHVCLVCVCVSVCVCVCVCAPSWLEVFSHPVIPLVTSDIILILQGGAKWLLLCSSTLHYLKQ